jgi:predicted glutamine amidotransferase
MRIMKKWKQLVLMVAGLIFVSSTGYLILESVTHKNIHSHNCRFWGIIFSESQPCPAQIISTHLDSLKKLGNINPDGWGIGYFVSPEEDVLLPVVTRGEPRAPQDPRYDKAVADLINYTYRCGIAHVRSGTSGPTSGIPNPHPFQRNAVNRDFQMLFAHNGSIPVDILLELIQAVNPFYFNINPPDYVSGYLDSDLFAIYIMALLDTYLDYTTEQCIKLAITRIDSALVIGSAKCNFVMSDGATLWAVCFTSGPDKGPSLYYSPFHAVSSFWVAASTPLDANIFNWAAVPNSTMVVLKPDRSPQLINIFDDNHPPTSKTGLYIIYPNPFHKLTLIKFETDDKIGNSKNIRIIIYNTIGQPVKSFTINRLTNSYVKQVIWNGRDNYGNALPSGMYFCTLDVGNSSYAKKVILLK